VRLWSIHPRYLDARGLVALWREGLLAQQVLLGATRGYRLHPQLIRFRACRNPAGALAVYLRGVADEADARGYRFDRRRIANRRYRGRLPVSGGQLQYEFAHLLGKLETRDPGLYRKLRSARRITAHPVFSRIPGGVEDWEVT